MNGIAPPMRPPASPRDAFLAALPHLLVAALIVVPARVEGNIDKPSVRALPISGVSKSISGLMKNTVEAPIKIVEPILPGERSTGDR